MQLNFDNCLDKMRGCWNGKNIGGTLGALFEGMRGVFDVRYYTVFQNPLIRAYVDGHEAPYISEGTVKKNNDHLREFAAPPAVAHADAANARGLGGAARKDAGRQSGAGPLQRAAGARHAGGHAACAVPGTERSDHTGRIRRTPHTAVHPHRPADKRRLPDFQ